MKSWKIYGAILFIGGLLLFKVSNLISGFFSDGGKKKLAEMERETKDYFKRVRFNSKNVASMENIKNVASRLWLLLEPAERAKSAEIINLLGPLNKDELKAVYKEFGLKIIPEIKLGLGFEDRAGDLVEVLKNELLDFNPFDWNGLSKVKALFKDTGLWEQ